MWNMLFSLDVICRFWEVVLRYFELENILPFSMFDLEDSEYCNNDFVEVREGGEAGDVLGRYCGNTLPSNMTTGHDLWIKFRTSPTVEGRGFMADYSFRK